MKKILLFMVAVLLVFGMVSCDQDVKTKTYKVMYNANGAVGDVPSSIEVEEGGTATVSSRGSLYMSGYDFAEWNTNKDGSGKVYRESQSLKVDRDIVLYAQWCIHSYSISYELDGGSYPEGRSNPSTYTIETESFTLNNPEKDGYEFLGWSAPENEEPNKNVSIDKGTIGDLLFIAVWRPLKSYSISYDVNGGEGSIGTVLKLEGESAEIATASEVSRKGYGFVCWNTESDGTGKDYNSGDLYKEDANLQLYAKWSIIKYSIEYFLIDGELAAGKSNPVEYTVETSDIILENPTKHGYEFVGWRYKDDSDALASTNFSIKKGTTGNLSIVAVWKALGTYTISYDANGGTGTVATQSEYKGTSLTISSGEGVERVGYIFSCWNTEKDGTGKDYNPNDTYNAGSDLRLYAKWNPIKYSIKYDLDGGAFPEGSVITEYTIETDTFTLPIPMRAEYEFIGWKAKVSDEAKKTVSIEKGSTGNLSFTAAWRKLNRYTVSYDVNGGSGSIESQSKLEGSSMTVSDAAGIERAGYTFVCWNTKSDGSGTDYEQNDVYGNDEDLVLYAKWNPIKYSITYDLAGGTLPEGKSNPADYTIETETFTLVSPEKEGYVFLGWIESGSTSETAEGNVSIAKGTTGIKTFIAEWIQLKKCVVTFDVNGADGGTAPSQLTIYEGDSFIVPSCGSLFRDDYVFEEWNTMAEGKGSRYPMSEEFEVHEDITLYAIWKESPLEYTYLSESDSYSIKCSDKSIKSIVIPLTYKGKLVTDIGYHAFYGCTALKEILIPSSVTSIGDSAFSGCSGLTSITIPSSVTSIKDSAFFGCRGLTSVTIPTSVTRMNGTAFRDCSGLESIEVEAGNPVYYSKGNCIVEKETKELVRGCNSSVIPDDVASIGDYAFYGCSGLTSITIPGSVTNIGDYAFYGCSGLTSITIPDSVTSIGYSAFRDCSGLTSITIPEGVTSIGNGAFSGCSGIKSVVLNDYVCKNFRMPGLFPESYQTIESVTIPKNVTYAGGYFFEDCSGLESVEVEAGNPVYYSKGNCVIEKETKKLVVGCNSSVIPDGVTIIGQWAFSGRRGLTSIEIPSSVMNIERYAFAGCSGLTNVTIPKGVTIINVSTFDGCSGLTSITIPDSVTSISGYAFADCIGLTSITIPDSVTSISNGAFENCIGLTSITIPEGVTNIGINPYKSAFSGCSGIKSVVLNDYVCKNFRMPGLFPESYQTIESVTIPDSVTGIGEKAFVYCRGLTSIEIPDSVTGIGRYAFENCSGLTSITIPDSVTSIGSGAFYGCSGLTSVKIPSSVTNIGNCTFYGCSGLTSVTIPSSVTSIEYSAFENCSGLTSIEISDSVTSIGESAFQDCRGLTSIEIPDSVTSIERYAFSGCSGIKSVVLNDYVCKNFNMVDLFPESCQTIESVTISKNVMYLGVYTFGNCSGLESFEVEAGNPVYYSKGNCIVEKETKKLVFGCNSSVIPDDVTSIGEQAFSGRKGLSSIEIPSSVTSIGRCAFDDCSGLTSITIPDSVTSISEYAFSGCSGIKSVVPNGYVCKSFRMAGLFPASCRTIASIVIPEGVTIIGRFAFEYCSGLTSITIPESVTSIWDSAFGYCSGLSDIDYSGTIAQWDSISKTWSWDYDTGNYTIHCTDGDIAKN